MAKATSTLSEPLLHAAVARLEAGEYESTLVSLLEAWRESGDGRTADAIDRVSEILSAKEKPIVAVGSVSAKKAWYQASDSLRPAVLGRLLEALPDGLDRDDRLEALMKWPADPRIGTAARRWLEKTPVKGANRTGFFGALFRLIEHTRDARLAELVGRISVSTARSPSAQAYSLKVWPALTALGEFYALLPKPAPLSPDATELLERIEALLARPPKEDEGGTTADEAELYERIYADPSDDEPRAVLADLLQQRGDPRGEFIALQMARHGTSTPPTPKEKKLLQQWISKWLGVLRMSKSRVVFERGFLAKGHYLGGLVKHTIGAREWLTITELELDPQAYGPDRTEVCISSVCRNLRTVRGLEERDYRNLPADAALPWTKVVWDIRWQDRLGAITEGAGTRFAAVRTLGVGHPSSVIRLEASAVIELLKAWPNVDELELAADTKLAGAILASPRGKQLKRLTLDALLISATFEAGELHVRVVRSNQDGITEMIRLLRELSPKRATLSFANAGLDATPLIDAARELNITLEVQGPKLA